MSGCASSGSGLSVTLTARMRANPHTTTGYQPNPLPRTHQCRYSASQSSHDDTQPGHTDDSKPSQLPFCEQILTQPRATKPTHCPAPTHTAIVRINPHTMTPETNELASPACYPATVREPIPIPGLHGQPVMSQDHRSRMPRHTQPDRSWLSQPDQPRKSSGAHIGTYATQQINPKQIHLHSQPSRHACRDIHNPAYCVSTVPHNAPTAPGCARPTNPRAGIRHTAYAGAYIIALRCCPRS